MKIPIDIKDLGSEDNELHSDFKEKFRFNEEEYLKNLEQENANTND